MNTSIVHNQRARKKHSLSMLTLFALAAGHGAICTPGCLLHAIAHFVSHSFCEFYFQLLAHRKRNENGVCIQFLLLFKGKEMQKKIWFLEKGTVCCTVVALAYSRFKILETLV